MRIVIETARISVWSGPRNVSTALMYSFAQREDTRVVDEPLYGHYLRVSGAAHPGREDVLRAVETDGRRVVAEILLGEWDRPVVFFKQMAHHLLDLPWDFLGSLTNVLLIRDPSEVLLSLRHSLPRPRLEDTGFPALARLHDHLRSAGEAPVIVDSRELLLDPEGVLRRLCERVGLAFDPAMLSWPAGARPEDGVWAPHWYRRVHESTGFRPYAPKTEPLPPELAEVATECRPIYDRLYADAIRGGGLG